MLIFVFTLVINKCRTNKWALCLSDKGWMMDGVFRFLSGMDDVALHGDNKLTIFVKKLNHSYLP